MINKTDEIMNEVKKVIKGKDDVVQKVLMAIVSRGHVLLDDIPGVGKTTMALSFSKIMGLDYQRLQCTPDTTPSDITGYSYYKKGTDKLEYRPGAAMCNLLLVDEINRTSSKTQSALLEVMEEGNVTVDGVTRTLPEPFIVIATQNPFGSAGTLLLPQSQLDRFAVCLGMGYPDVESHISILKDRNKEKPLDQIRQVVSRDEMIQMQNEVNDIDVEDGLFEYITHLAEETRHSSDILLGISPRGALSVVRMAKANAYLSGRNYVVPQDIVDIFADVAAHRIVISPKAKISGITAKDLVVKILDTTKTPSIRL